MHATIQPLAWWRARFATRLHANVSITSKRLILVRMPHEHADEQQTERWRGRRPAWAKILVSCESEQGAPRRCWVPWTLQSWFGLCPRSELVVRQFSNGVALHNKLSLAWSLTSDVDRR